MSKMNALSMAEQDELMYQHEQEQMQELRNEGQQELRNRLIWVINRDITSAIRAGQHTQYVEGLLKALKLVENPLS